MRQRAVLMAIAELRLAITCGEQDDPLGVARLIESGLREREGTR
jgi:hypothetical protein